MHHFFSVSSITSKITLIYGKKRRKSGIWVKIYTIIVLTLLTELIHDIDFLTISLYSYSTLMYSHSSHNILICRFSVKCIPFLTYIPYSSFWLQSSTSNNPKYWQKSIFSFCLFFLSARTSKGKTTVDILGKVKKDMAEEREEIMV